MKYKGGDVDNREVMSPGDMRSFKSWTIGIGIAMILLGLLITGLAFIATLVSVVLLGIVVMVRGIAETIYAFHTRAHEHYRWRLFGGILALVIGMFIVLRPATTAAILTLFIALFLVVNGLFAAIWSGFKHPPRWGLTMSSGIVSILLGLALAAGWPSSALWFIGLVIGVETLLQGIALITLGSAVRVG